MRVVVSMVVGYQLVIFHLEHSFYIICLDQEEDPVGDWGTPNSHWSLGHKSFAPQSSIGARLVNHFLSLQKLVTGFYTCSEIMTEYDKCSDMLQKYFKVMPKKFRHNLFMHCGINNKVFDASKSSNTNYLYPLSNCDHS